jgi:subtilisin family serine protease
VLFVTSAGNDGRNIDVYPDYPASYNLPNLIVVGAISPQGLYTPWSNFGAQTVDLAAPGQYILSTGAEGGTIAMDGTNIAVPFVSGAAALLWSAKPNATAVQIKNAILSGVDANVFPVRSTGTLNVSKALQQLQ